MKDENAPYNLVVSFTIMGMGTLFPYNAFISCVDFFKLIQPKVDIISQLTATMLSSLLITTLLLLLLPKSSKHFLCDPTQRIKIGFILEACILALLSILTYRVSMSDDTPGIPIWLILVLAFLVGVGDAVSQSGLYIYAAAHHNQYIMAVTLGCATAGIMVSFLKIITKAIFSNNLILDTRVYFAISSAFLLVSLSSVFYTQKVITSLNLENKSTQYLDGPKDEFTIEEYEDELEMTQPNERSNLQHRHNSNETTCLQNDNILTESTINQKTRENPHKSLYVRVSIFLWKPLFALFLNFFVTLSLFPGVVTAIPSKNTWLPVILITTLNIFDAVGRILLSEHVFKGFLCKYLLQTNSINGSSEYWYNTSNHQENYESSSSNPENEDTSTVQTRLQEFRPRNPLVNFDCLVFYPSISRVLFFPFIIACIAFYPDQEAESYNSDESFFDKIINFVFLSNFGRVLIIAIFSVTNGFIAAACFMCGPEMITLTGFHTKVVDQTDNKIMTSEKNIDECRDAASLLLLLACFTGLTAGAYSGLALEEYVSFTYG